jgi:hypothetical protein
MTDQRRVAPTIRPAIALQMANWRNIFGKRNNESKPDPSHTMFLTRTSYFLFVRDLATEQRTNPRYE